VKVDDTTPGVEEGRNAGMWSVGLALSGNEMGYTLADVQGMKAEHPTEYEARLAKARRRLQDAGAHYVIDSVAELPAVIENIESRLSKGDAP